MGGKSTETLFNALLVAYIGKHAVEDANACALAGEHKPRLRHKSEQTYGFESDRFASRIRTRDNEGVEIHSERNGYRNNGPGVEQRVAGSFKDEGAVCVYSRLACVHAEG